MTFEEWWRSGNAAEIAERLGLDFLDEDEQEAVRKFSRATWDAAQPKWKPIKDAPLNVRILAAMKGDEPDICKLSLSPSGILVAQLDCGSQYNAKDIYEVYTELPKP